MSQLNFITLTWTMSLAGVMHTEIFIVRMAKDRFAHRKREKAKKGEVLYIVYSRRNYLGINEILVQK